MVEALTWAAVVLVGGSVLLLERRCLGQMAAVQPLAVLLAVGLATGLQETCVWLGASLQLLAAGQGRAADWALVGVSAGAGVALASALGIPMAPGEPSALALLAASILAGAVASRTVQRTLSRRDGETFRRCGFWDAEGLANGCRALVRRRILRGLLVGGAEGLVASVVAAGAAAAAAGLARPGSAWTAVATIAVPSLGAGVAIASLSGRKYAILSGLGLALCLGSTVLP